MFHDPEGWGLKKPELILSITGATKSFNISNRYKTAFKKGLVKAAENVECWILTNGFNSGISKLVGEAIAENSFGNKITLVGIVSKSVISFNESLEVFSNNKLLTWKNNISLYIFYFM
jgi:transient receptor potential cation channel subfamily M protein 6